MGILSIVILGALIFFHELGHFLFAKYFGVGVAEFAIGFGPKLFSNVYGKTRYSLRLIPLGGYVRMIGEQASVIEGQPTEDAPPVDPHEIDLLKDRSVWFINKKLYQKALIVFAGPFFNLIFAYVLAVSVIAIYGVAKPTDSTVIGELLDNYPAQKAGILIGDTVKQVNGKEVSTFKEIRDTVESTQDGPLVFLIERNGQQLSFDLRSKEIAPEVDYLMGSGTGKKGFMVGISQVTERESVSMPRSIVEGGLYVGYLCWMNVKSIWGLFQGIISPKSLGGPLSILKEAAKSAQSGLEKTFGFMIFLNVGLAVLNLLPIPILDGGHLTFFLIEAIRGKPVTEKFQEYATKIGMTALLMLMIYALSNDVRNIFFS